MREEVFDVVVVGGGGSGLAAAVEAAQQTVQVIVLEKGSELRGTTGIAVGSITASGTRYQKRLGVEDSPDAHLEDYLVLAGARASCDNAELRRLLVDNVGSTVDWLGDIGVEFFGPVAEPPHRKPRMHNVLPSSRSYIYHLSRAARARGVRIQLDTPATELLREGSRITGVLAQQEHGTPVRYLARRGVVLAGGDFSNDLTFRTERFGPEAAGYAAANPHATGDCQRMAMAVGATICNADLFEGPQMRFPPPPKESWLLRVPPLRIFTRPMRWALCHLPATLVRPFALSFVTTYLAPDARLFQSGALLFDQTGAGSGNAEATSASAARCSFLIFDAHLYRIFSSYPHYIATAPNVAFAYADDFRRNRPDLFFSAPDLSTLAKRIGASPSELSAAIVAHNQAGGDAKVPRQSISEPPFFALGPVLPYILTTHGGLRVSRELEVLGADGLPICGLYAAGSAGRGGALLPGHGHSLGWAFTSGRLAGRAAARLS